MGKGSGDPGERVLTLQRKLTDLLLTYTPNYPEVIRVRTEIETLKGQMASGQAPLASDAGAADGEVALLNPVFQQLREEMTRADLELAALTAKDEQLRRLMESKKTYLRSMPAEKKSLTDLEMARATTKNIYEELVARLGQAEVSKQMEVQDKASTFRIVDPAVLPMKPVSPDRVKIMLFGILAGLAGGFGLVVLLDSVDRSVKTVDSSNPSGSR
ncbi:MAG: GNVR domain-containing protein [Thermodesulfovibrionales bacterium]